MKKVIIALDGHSSCGKSTTAKRVAAKLGYAFIDTGAMYRAVSLYFHENHVTLTNPKEVEKALADIHISFQFNEHRGASDVYLNGLNVEEEIRKMYISEMVSETSAITLVRKAMVAQQQQMAKHRGVVMDGRDIGTKVFPDAEVKVFMTADPVIRAERRQKELLDKGELVDLDEIIDNLKKRDILDSTRAEGPLVQAEDAVLMDTSFMTLEEQVNFVLQLHQNVLERL
ncbi:MULTISPECIES: (d)CMP kinase [unclassified Arcicella]|uniref:(d)CMP kinase n=1 Tax=unclassified Arcicella TaxID=2644986 RepID=UPI0028601E47|nr:MULTISPECIES: (d)CMP kinase [unclassified Arcicella]MDR6560850.1 cytidylate kinase [Arcicella sp. BE51]MDR6810734.1 cytidylate kinase [Arcicella sp. BE140]MDR6822084.1 cytidylate kinase [Arcicella sp. BE139]